MNIAHKQIGIFDILLQALSIPGFDEVVNGSIKLFLGDKIISPLLLQLYHVLRERVPGQLHGCNNNTPCQHRKQISRKGAFVWGSLSVAIL